MFAVEIELYVNGDQHIIQSFSGIYDVKGKMPTYVEFPSSYIFNVGEHWVTVYIDKFQRGEYFDSCGLPPHYTIFKFLESSCIKWKYNIHRVQSKSSHLCGHYALMFLRHRSMGQEFNDFIYNFMNISDNERDNRIQRLFLRSYGSYKICSVERAVEEMKMLFSRMENRKHWK